MTLPAQSSRHTPCAVATPSLMRRHTACAYYFESTMRFLLMPIRSTKQGVQINVGKDGDEYNAIVNTMQAHPDDMKALGVSNGGAIRVRTDVGEAEFICVEAKVPRGMMFVPYGPPTCQLY